MTFNDLAQVFGVLIIGFIVAGWAARKAFKKPKRGRYFKRKLDD